MPHPTRMRNKEESQGTLSLTSTTLLGGEDLGKRVVRAGSLPSAGHLSVRETYLSAGHDLPVTLLANSVHRYWKAAQMTKWKSIFEPLKQATLTLLCFGRAYGSFDAFTLLFTRYNLR